MRTLKPTTGVLHDLIILFSISLHYIIRSIANERDETVLKIRLISAEEEVVMSDGFVVVSDAEGLEDANNIFMIFRF